MGKVYQSSASYDEVIRREVSAIVWVFGVHLVLSWRSAEDSRLAYRVVYLAMYSLSLS